MAETAFAAPTSRAEALELAADDDSVLVAGGTALALLVKSGLVEPARLVWLGRVPELRGVSPTSDGGVRVGAATTLTEIAESRGLATAHPLLGRAAASVANPRVRAVATLGGALVHADPRQDLLPALLVADGAVHLAGPAGERTLRLRDGFFRGLMETAVGPGELVTGVTLPPAGEGAREAYHRFTPASRDDYPTLSVALRVRTTPSGEIADVALALGGVASTPLWIDEAAARAVGRAPSAATIDELAQLASSLAAPSDDQRGSAEYKTAMTEVCTRQALHELLVR